MGFRDRYLSALAKTYQPTIAIRPQLRVVFGLDGIFSAGQNKNQSSEGRSRCSFLVIKKGCPKTDTLFNEHDERLVNAG